MKIFNKKKNVHILVAKAYIPNPENKPIVNHINGNKLDNTVNNLEWVTHCQNSQHAIDTGLNPCTKAVIQYSLQNEFIAKFGSLKEAERKTTVNRSHIADACNRKPLKFKGYKWEYA